MPEPTMRDLERLLIRSGRAHAETQASVLELRADVAKLAAQQAGNKLLVAAVDELTTRVDHLSDKHEAGNQLLAGMRSQGNSSFDIAVALSRRFRKLVQRLTEKGVIALEALREDELETEGENVNAAKLRAVEGRSE